ncbi:uncharacterized protein SRS1_15273 [Sporisorium reilianum f. sp. reilianum]|uniref:Uncharacterized protein n=1 Tax=Sporisorium reilianum f. sp. reilianum TaxID=72559 RepID=A0A2N8UIS2_9BASI|nr:uncharacterized protein SRS1_15273 [Sporisorium reilianum f. sp. reilianum]
MSSTKTNSTNTAVPASTNSSASTALPQTTAGSNAAGQASTATAGASSASNNMTLLTFGPLSSCIDLPNLSAGSVPRTANMADAARKQAIQTWLASLPTTSSCSALSWTLRPDYSPHLQAMSTFQAQLEQLFPAVANTSSTGGVNGIANASSASSNTSFFPSTPATSAFSASTSSTSTLPTTLPLWIGITLASTALVHLLALILHICSDLDALFPSLVAKLHSRPEEFELPQHVQQPNESTTTLVEEPTGDADAKADPPQYTEPPADAGKAGVEGGMVETPWLIRMARKCKRLVVPLLLVSALAMVGVAVVLNAKFVVGAVGGFGGSSVAASLPVASSAGSNATVTGANVTSAAVTSMSADSSRSHPATSATSSMADVAATSTATPVALSTSDRVEKVTASSTAPAVLATSSMTKLVRRQVNFFPTASSSTPSSSLAASLAPTTSTATPSPTEPNASLFPTLTTTTNPPSSTTTTSTPTLTASPSASATATSTTTSTSAFVLQRSSSIHRLWWIVMLDLVLWFAQRRRTRSQTALDKARAFVVGQLADAGKRALK